MESSYATQIHSLRKTGSLSALAYLIFSLVTVGLVFLPGMYFLIGLVPTIISMLIGFSTGFKAAVLERLEIDWKINQKLDALKEYSVKEKSKLDHKD